MSVHGDAPLSIATSLEAVETGSTTRTLEGAVTSLGPNRPPRGLLRATEVHLSPVGSPRTYTFSTTASRPARDIPRVETLARGAISSVHSRDVGE